MFFYNQFLATVGDESQQVTKRLVTASTQEKAVLGLKKQKFRVLAIEPRKNPFMESLKKGKIEFGAVANKRDLATFSNNLALMGPGWGRSSEIREEPNNLPHTPGGGTDWTRLDFGCPFH